MDGGSPHCTRGSDQDHPQEKKWKKAKWLSEEALQTAEKREATGKGEKGIHPVKCIVSKNRKER